MYDWNVDTEILLESPLAGETSCLHAINPMSFQVQKGLLASKWVVSLQGGSQAKLLQTTETIAALSVTRFP